MGCVSSVDARGKNEGRVDTNFRMPDYDKLAEDLKVARAKESLLNKNRETESALHAKDKSDSKALLTKDFVSDDEDSFITVEEVHQAALELQQLEIERSDREEEIEVHETTTPILQDSIKDRVSLFTQDSSVQNSSVPSSPLMSETRMTPEVLQVAPELQKKMAKLEKAKKKSAKKAKKEEFHLKRKPFQSEEVTSSKRRGPNYAAIVSDSMVIEQMC